MIDVLQGLLGAIVLIVGAFFFGRQKGKEDLRVEQKAKELETAKEVLEVKPSADRDAALKRLHGNGKLDSLQPEPTEHQLKLPL